MKMFKNLLDHANFGRLCTKTNFQFNYVRRTDVELPSNRRKVDFRFSTMRKCQIYNPDVKKIGPWTVKCPVARNSPVTCKLSVEKLYQ